jgi:phage FluMu protein gp41
MAARKNSGAAHTTKIVEGRLHLTASLVHGLNIEGVQQKEFEVREATTEDLFAAEKEVPAHNVLAFDGQMVCQQLVRIGSYKGPFTLELLSKLKTYDFALLRQKTLELETLGKPEQVS